MCAVKGCNKSEYKVTVEAGRFGTIVVIPFCREHWKDEERYQAELKEYEAAQDKTVGILTPEPKEAQ
jgi:hypothetical protein